MCAVENEFSLVFLTQRKEQVSGHVVSSHVIHDVLHTQGASSVCAQGWARDVKARDRDETFVGHETLPRR